MTYSEIKKDVVFWITGSGTGDTDFSDTDIVRGVNEYYNEVVSIIMKADGRWEWDDNNLTTLPIAVTDLVSAQDDYEIDAADFLNVKRVECKDSSGNWIQLEPLSFEDKQGTAMTEWAETDGTPQYYDKLGNSVVLYPATNYNSTGGLKVYFQRTPSYFVYDDTTKTPGFNPLYHRYLSMGAALDYCIVNDMTSRVTMLTAKINDMRQRILDDYSKRSRDEHLQMRVSGGDYEVDQDNLQVKENSVG